jgi:single-stranded-DNA-specific exonuclease
MRWTIKPKPSEDKIKHLAQALQVEEFVAQLLVQRGIETYEDAKLFFRPFRAPSRSLSDERYG